MKKILSNLSIKNKILFLFSACVLMVIVLITYLGSTYSQQREQKIGEQYIREIAKSYAQRLGKQLDRAVVTASTMATSLAENYNPKLPLKLSDVQIEQMIRNILGNEESFVGVKIILEPNHINGVSNNNLVDTVINESDTNFFAKLAEHKFRPKNTIPTAIYWFAVDLPSGRTVYNIPVKDVENEVFYQTVKTTLAPVMNPPTTYKVQDKKYQLISVACPIVYQNTFYGVVLIEMPLTNLRKIVDEDTGIGDETTLTLLTDNKLIAVSTSKPYLIGQEVSKLFRNTVINSMDKNEVFIFENQNDVTLNTTVQIDIEKVKKNWLLHLQTPANNLTNVLSKDILNIRLILFLIFALMLVGIYYFIEYLFKPLYQLRNIGENIALGDLNHEISVRETGREIAMFKTTFINIVTSLMRVSTFADQIGKGKLDDDFQPISDKDLLGYSLVKMRKSLSVAQIEEEKHRNENAIRFWKSQGLTKFADILRKNNDNIKQLSYEIIFNLVQYIEANQGGLFVCNDDNKDHIFLELEGAYAYNKRKYHQRIIELKEGIVGTCAVEKKTVYLKNVPEDYIEITSGLGKARPRVLLVVPLVSEGRVMGVLEIASFEEFLPHHIEFVEEVAESIASTLLSVHVSQQTNLFWEQSKLQGQEMATKEVELRQNVEELQATKEEMDKRNNEFLEKIYFFEQILDVVPYFVSVTDIEMRWVFINRALEKYLNVDRTEVYGKYCLEFGSSICNNENCSIECLKKEKKSPLFEHRERMYFTQTSYVHNSEDEVIGHIEVIIDCTDLKNSEFELHRLTNQMQGFLTALNNTTLMVELAVDGTILTANEHFLKLLGFTLEELVGNNVKYLIPDEELVSFKKAWTKVLEGETYKDTVQRINKTGDKMWLKMAYNPMLDLDGNVEKIIFFGNITQQK